MGKQRILHKDELDDILDKYINDAIYDSDELAEFAKYEVPMLIQQIHLLHELYRQQVDLSNEILSAMIEGIGE